MTPRLAALARLGRRGRALAALVSEHGRTGAAERLGVRGEDIDAIVRIADALPEQERAPITPRAYVPVRMLTKAERDGLALLVSDLVRAVGLRPLARRVGCSPRAIVLYARGLMTRTASMLSPLSRVLGMRDASHLLLAAGAVGYEPRPSPRRPAKPRRVSDAVYEYVGLEVVDVEPRGPSGALIVACARLGASASEVAARCCVPVSDVHAAIGGADLGHEAMEALGLLLVELSDPPPTPLKTIGRRGA